MSHSLFFIGALDYPNIPQAGDAVKNRYLLTFFQKSLGTVRYVDTQRWKKNPLILLRVLGNLLFRHYDNIVISTSNVSAYRLVRLTTSMHLRSRIYYFMIGGYTPVKIKQGLYKAAPFHKLERIIVEADRVMELYHEVGLDNTYRLYNFKPVRYVPDLTAPRGAERIRFVFLSRLTELKGIFHILESVRQLNESGLEQRYEVDFYGRVDADVHERFIAQCDALPNVSYKGFLQLDTAEGYATLASYDAMLFPTMHVTEGFPGVIADAAIAALPVIASDWQYAEEIIGDGRCGLLFKTGDNEALTATMRRVIDDPALLQPLRRAALERTALYDVDRVLNDHLLDELKMNNPL